MIRKLLAVTVVLFSLFASTAWADEEQYPAKGDGEEVEKEVDAKPVALAKTGSDTMPLVMTAAGLIVVGGVLVTSVRRRRAAAAPVSVS